MQTTQERIKERKLRLLTPNTCLVYKAAQCFISPALIHSQPVQPQGEMCSKCPIITLVIDIIFSHLYSCDCATTNCRAALAMCALISSLSFHGGVSR